MGFYSVLERVLAYRRFCLKVANAYRVDEQPPCYSLWFIKRTWRYFRSRIVRFIIGCFKHSEATFGLCLEKLIYRSVKKKIDNLSPDTQLFLISRHDFGPLICMIHYAALWEKERGKVGIIILAQEQAFVCSLVKLVCPEAVIIDCFLLRNFKTLYKNQEIFSATFQNVYSQVLIENNKAIFIWDNQFSFLEESFFVIGEYVRHFDPIVKFEGKKPKRFIAAYLTFRENYFVRKKYWDDYTDMVVSRSALKPNSIVEKTRKSLIREINITRPYVVLNLSSIKTTSGNILTDRRRIQYPHRFNGLIDVLIEKGFDVVLQGRKEQPYFKPRKYFFDYAHSKYCTPENDLALYSDALFVVAAKSGPEIFCSLFDIPLLGVNYNENVLMLHNVKYRFFYKHIKGPKGSYLNWKEVLRSPLFFEFGVETVHPNSKAYIYEEMSEEELIDSLEEFIPFIHTPKETWLNYSENQQRFRQSLTPLHFDLYACPSVPCDTYLSSVRSGA